MIIFWRTQCGKCCLCLFSIGGSERPNIYLIAMLSLTPKGVFLYFIAVQLRANVGVKRTLSYV